MNSIPSNPSGKILKLIESGHLVPGSRFPTSRNLAERWGVGRTAVNRAVTELIGRGVLHRQGRRVFVGNVDSGSEVRAPIDLFIESWHDDRIVAKLAHRWGLEVRSHQSVEPEDRRRQLLDLIESRRPTSGVIIYGTECDKQLIEIQKLHIPIVVFGNYSLNYSYVAYDPTPVAQLAIEHLTGLGHRELAFLAPITIQSYPLMHLDVEKAYVTTCKQMGLLSSAQRLFTATEELTSIRKAWDHLRLKHHKVTALICEEMITAEMIMSLAKADGVQVPGEISILTTYEQDRSKSTGQLPVTAIQIDHKQVIQIAALLLLDDIENSRTSRGRPSQRTALCQPRLFERGSTAAIHPQMVAAAAQAHRTGDPIFPTGLTWPEDRQKRLAKVARLNAQRFKGVNDRSRPQYTPLDLSPHVNRQMTRHYGWLGKLPLLHLPAGDHEMHGVPMTILEKALVLRSRFARRANGIPLPESVTLEVNREVDGVFILHAGGWLKFHEAIAQYDFRLASSTKSVEVMAFGSGRVEEKEKEARQQKSIIQDWHPSTPYFTSENAKPFLVTQKEDPIRYLRYLYLYHWPNPKPGTELKDITVRTLQPDLQRTLGILAITTYRATGKIH